jgi:hypothetical protein
MKRSISVLGLVLWAGAAASADVAYVSGSAGEPWGMPGNVNALNDVYGNGNWDRLDFPSAVDKGLFKSYDCIVLDGGDGADSEFNAFIEANRGSMEAFVNGGGRMLINAARWGADPVDLDVGFGVTLQYGPGYSDGFAVDVNHAIFQGPFGATGDYFQGDGLSHDIVLGKDLTPLMYGGKGPDVILAEKSWGAGHVMVGGLTLPFFGEHGAWSANTKDFHRNLYTYFCKVPSPGAAGLLGLAGLAAARRRR